MPRSRSGRATRCSGADALKPGETVAVPDGPNAHLFVAEGEVDLEGAGTLVAGDAARLVGAGEPEAERWRGRRRGADLGDRMTTHKEPEAGLEGGPSATRRPQRREEIKARQTQQGTGPSGRRPRGACTTSRCLSNDVERTVEFYQGLLEFPLTEMFENRDYGGSTHFFFDIGNGNCARVLRPPRPRPRARTRRCSVACTTSPSRSSPIAGST